MIFKSPYADVAIPNVSLGRFILDRLEVYGEKPAFIDGLTDRVVSYRQLGDLIRRVACGLHQRGFRNGDVLAIYSPNLPEYAAAFHGVILAGGIVTTLNPMYSADEVAYQLKDSGAKYLLTISKLMDNAVKAAAKSDIEEIFSFDPVEGATSFAELLNNDGTLPVVAINPANDLAVLPYSSGTTGLSKGVMLTHGNIVANVTQCEGMTGADLTGEQDRIIGVLPFFHIFGIAAIVTIGLVRGVTIVTMPRFDLEQFLGLIQKHKITRLNVVPPMLVAMAKHPMVAQFDMSSLVEMACGAAPLSAELTDAVRARIGCRVIQGFGMTETSPVTHFYTSHLTPVDNAASVGPLIPNTEAMIVDTQTGQPLGANERGELWLRGPQVMKGYLNNVEATKLTIDDAGWLHTGDIGYADEHGFFYIVDRLKELIKYKGYQVAPAELEALLLTHAAIADVAVIPSVDEEAGEVPKAYVVLKSEITGDELMAWVAERVPPHKKIRRVEFIETVPKSPAGKILRRVLIEQERARVSV